MLSLDLDIGVIYTGERELMPRLLTTMSASGEGLRMRLILVDNASTQRRCERMGTGSEPGCVNLRKSASREVPVPICSQPHDIEPWCDYFPETRVLRNGRRLSYAANLNRILDASSARCVLLMNTDMYFDPREQCLGRMVAFMDGNPRCGVAGCRLYHADGADAHAARRFQTLPLILARRCGLGRLLHGTVDRHFYAEHALDGTWPCDWLSGCFLMVRREAIQSVGRFDEGYGKYFEDVDLCLRMARVGWQVMYHGATSCYHLESRASRNPFSADAWIHLRAYLRWLRRWGLHSAGATP